MMKPKRGLNILICGAMMLSFSPQAILAKDITQNEQSPTSSLFQEESHLVESVQQQINDLPTFQRLQNMTKEEQQEVYNKLQVAHEAYAALIDEQKKQITGAEIFESLFEVFNSMMALAAGETGAFTVTGGSVGTDYEYTPSEKETEGGVLTIKNSTPITISMDSATTTPTYDRIVIDANATANITFAGVNITPQDAITKDGYSGIDLSDGATLNITLQENTENEINGGTSTTGLPAPGIHVPESAVLTIQGKGSLTVTGGASISGVGAVGIGGGNVDSGTGDSCGTVIITGGNLKIKAGNGGGSDDNSPDIGGGIGGYMAAGGSGGTVIILTPINNGATLDIGGGAGYSYGDDGQGIRPVPGEANTYEVWGELTLPEGVTIPEGAILTGQGSLAEGSKLTQSAPTSAPTVSDISQIIGASVTLDTVADGIGKAQYARVESSDNRTVPDEDAWQNSPTFQNLKNSTAYTFYTRYYKTNFYQASPSSPGLTVITAPHTSAVSINYEAETISILNPNVEVSPNSDFSRLFKTGDRITSLIALRLYMRAKVEDGTQAPIRGVTTVSIPPRPNHADSITVVNASAAGVNDGKITGVSCDMEYREENITTWTDCAGDTVENLAPGTYYVRTKATENSFASVSAEVTIGVGNIITIELPTFDSVYFGYPTPDPKPIKIHNSSGEEVTITGVSCTGEAFNLRAEANPNIFKVPAGGTNSYYSLQPNPGLYPREYASTITVTYRDTNDNSYAVTATARFAVLPQPTDEDTNIVGGGGSSVQLNPVYRAYNPNNGEHLYTLDETEYKHVTSNGWDAEGIAFMAETEKNGQALYRVYNPNSGLHHYTLDENEKNTLVSLGWHDEKVAWYTSKKTQSAPVYRVYNPNDGNHHYTMNQQEKDVLVSLGWQFEGIAFRTVPIETK